MDRRPDSGLANRPVPAGARCVCLLAFSLFLAGCLGVGPTGLSREELSPARTRLVPAPAGEVRAAAVAVLEEEGASPERNDESGRLQSGLLQRRLRRLDRRQLEELLKIADFEPARRLGMQGLSEIQIRYTIDVAALEERASRVEIVAELAAIDRSQVLFLGPGAATVVPRRYPLRSRGLLERRLLLRIAERVLHGEEVLHYLGELGKD